MMLMLAIAATVAQAPAAPRVSPPRLQDISQAIDGGRLKEARLLIGRAVSAGVTGPALERLMADLSFASGTYEQAFTGYQHLANSSAKQPSDCEKGAVAALEIGRLGAAKQLVDCAVAVPHPSWRAWDAKGVLADFGHDWASADEAYARAHQLSPENARVMNNQGWSKLMRGDWAGAIPFLEQAATLDSKSARIANNLELAKAALASDLPRRAAGETDEDWAARLNDAGVVAALLGDKKRAVAAFTQALDANPVWYDRAANNLKAVSQD